MTPGALVYLSDTAGEIADAADTVPVVVGRALSATDVYFDFAASGLGPTIEAAEIAAGAVTKTKLAGGFLKVALAAGTAAATDVVVAAIAVGDELVFVGSFTTAAAIATLADRTAEYAIQAGGLDKAAGTDETNNQLVIIYLDLT
jgi:hypothetical protein